MIKKIKEKIYNLLRWSEKYTKTDMVYLAHGGFWLSFGQIISSLSSFLLAIAFANLLPKETYGNYKYILSIASILSISTLSGMSTSITRSIARGFDNSFIPALKTRITWGIFGAIGSILLASYYLINHNFNLAISFLIIAAFIPLDDPFQMYNSLLQGKKLFKKSTKYLIISKIFSFTFILGTIFITKNLPIILFSYFFSWTIIRFIFLKISLKNINKNTKADNESIVYGKHLSLIKGIDVGASSLSSVFLFHVAGNNALAIFSLAIAPIEQIRSLLKMVNTLILPKISHDSWQLPSMKSFIKKMIPVSIGSTILIFTYILFAPLIFKIFFPQYLGSINFSQIYALSLFFTVINTIQNTILNAKQKTKEIYIINFLDITLNILLTIPMIYFFQIWGLVWSGIIIKILQTIVIFFLIYKEKLLSFIHDKK